MPRQLWDFVDASGNNVIRAWAKGLQKQQLGKLNNRLDLLSKGAADFSPNFLTGTPHGHVKKLKVNGKVQLRLMLCAGPINTGAEYTLLVPAIEKNWKLEPSDAYDKAADRRLEVIRNPGEKRCPHERVG